LAEGAALRVGAVNFAISVSCASHEFRSTTRIWANRNLGSGPSAKVARGVETKKADVIKYPEALDHVGLLVNEPPLQTRVARQLVIGQFQSTFARTPIQVCVGGATAADCRETKGKTK
jgi:23S rRNA G2445 N2-methylase RlmL